jgi:hypothetical protein
MASKSRRDLHEDVDDDPFLAIPARVRQDQQGGEDDDHGNTVSDKRRLPERQDQRIRVKLRESNPFLVYQYPLKVHFEADVLRDPVVWPTRPPSPPPEMLGRPQLHLGIRTVLRASRGR